jgi:hypothetical protein
MATTVGQLDIRMNLELQRLEGQIDAANKKVANMSRRMQSDVSKAAKNINKALGAVGVTLSAGAVIAFGKQVLALGGQITDLSNQAGISTDAFQTFSNVAAESGVDAQQVANAFVQMRKNIEEAAQGTKTQADALDALGLRAVRLQTLAPERQFEAIAKAIAGATNKNAAFNAGLEILGAKNAPKLTEVLQRLGTEGFDALAKSTENLRIAPDQLKTLDDAGDKLERIWTQLKVISAKAFVVTVDFVQNGSAGPVGTSLSNVSDLGINDSDPMWQQVMAQNRAERELLQSTPEFKERTEVLEYARLAMEETVRTTEDAAEAQALFNKQLEAGTKASEAFDKRVTARGDKSTDANIKGLLLGPSEQEMARFNERVAERNKLLQEGAAVTAAVRTPLENYNVALSRLNDLQSAGAITSDVYDKAVRVEGEAFQQATEKAGEYAGSLSDLEEPMDKFSQTAAAMWENIADRTSAALSDMLLDADAKFSDFAGGIARMIADVALRMAIINPIINGVFGLSGTNALASVWGARASGGPMSAGGSYLVGENGPELVTPTANSMVTPNHAISGMGGSTTVINADLRGASVEAVMRLEQYVRSIDGSLERRSMAANANERARGGGLGRRLGS